METALQKYHSIKLKHIIPPMTSMPIVCCDSSVIEVLEFLRTRHHVWVINCEEDRELLGIIEYLNVIDLLLPPEKHKMNIGTTRSTLRSIIGGAKTAREIMEKNALTINHNQTVLDALLKMKNYGVRILGVVDDDGKLVGEVNLKILIDKFLSLCL